jgi:hypothetical protein
MAVKESVLRGPKATVSKTRNALRTMTTGTQVMTLPKGARILGFLLNGVASDAGTTATISVGSTVAANEFVSAQDVKTAASGIGPRLLPGVSGAIGVARAAETPIFFKYAETGTASAAGNWQISVFYTQSNTINDETI